MRIPRPKRTGLAALATAGAVIAVACGSGGSETDRRGDQGATLQQQDSGEDDPATRLTEQAAGQEAGQGDQTTAEAGEQSDQAEAQRQAEAEAQADEQTQAGEQAQAGAGEVAAARGNPFLPIDATETPFGEPILRDLDPPRFFGTRWGTDFSISLVEFWEISSGGVPRDGIPSIDDPRFISVAEAAAIYADSAPVIQLEVNGDARAYPLEILTWHEIVNDVVGGVPVVVTFCPLCNTAIAFERTLGETTFDFGVSGTLRNSDLIMYDRQTESLWQQIGGKAIVGDMVGARLPILSASIVSWGAFSAQYPDAIVLSRDTGHSRDYGRNPYAGYDSVSNVPFLFFGEIDGQLSAFERVVTLDLPGEVVAYPFAFLEQERAVADLRGGREIVIFWTPGASSALDSSAIDEGRDVGSTGVFERELDGQLLDFQPNPDDPSTFIDAQTQSVWNIFGRADSGPLAGAALTPVVHANHFWFAWAAFQPDTIIVGND